MRWAVWLARHERIARVINHGPIRAWVSRRVWQSLDAIPGFREEIAQAKLDFEAGRFYTYSETGECHPNPDWPKDGPQPAHD